MCYFYVSVDKDTLFKESDFVSAHTALTPETAGKIARDHISLKFTSKIWRKGCETLRSNYYKYIISVARWCANKKVIESNNPVWFWFSVFWGKNRKLQRSRGTSRRELQVNALSEWIIGIYLHEFINNEREISILQEAPECGIENFEFIVSENPDNSRAISALTFLLFKLHTLYEFRFSNWMTCTTWHWVVTKQPPWRHHRGVIAVV